MPSENKSDSDYSSRSITHVTRQASRINSSTPSKQPQKIIPGLDYGVELLANTKYNSSKILDNGTNVSMSAGAGGGGVVTSPGSHHGSDDSSLEERINRSSLLQRLKENDPAAKKPSLFDTKSTNSSVARKRIQLLRPTKTVPSTPLQSAMPSPPPLVQSPPPMAHTPPSMVNRPSLANTQMHGSDIPMHKSVQMHRSNTPSDEHSSRRHSRDHHHSDSGERYSDRRDGGERERDRRDEDRDRSRDRRDDDRNRRDDDRHRGGSSTSSDSDDHDHDHMPSLHQSELDFTNKTNSLTERPGGLLDSELDKMNADELNEPEQKPAEEILTPQELMKRKRKALLHIKILELQGFERFRDVGLSHTLEEIKEVEDEQMERRNLANGIESLKKVLVGGTYVVEMLNRRFNPFDFNLDGWSEQICESRDEYNEVLEELYYKYGDKVSMAPELKLVMLLAGSAMMFHFSKSLFSNNASIPGFEQVMKKNPELKKAFEQAAMNEMHGGGGVAAAAGGGGNGMLSYILGNMTGDPRAGNAINNFMNTGGNPGSGASGGPVGGGGFRPPEDPNGVLNGGAANRPPTPTNIEQVPPKRATRSNRERV